MLFFIYFLNFKGSDLNLYFQEILIPKLSKNENVSVCTNPGVGKTLVAGVSIFNSIDLREKYTEAIYLVESYEAAKQTTAYLAKLFAFTDVSIGVAVRLEKSFTTHFDFHLLVGTPKEMASHRMLL